ncbi:MAG TPA: AraC family transcriptional regulator [Acetobacteraceae bacterium]|jgi:AraC family transcriptional regulator|nr:AraC family transcriptional regulator [Acetobacteraceae bacterium]
MAATTLLAGGSITAVDYCCNRGPADPPYPEQHDSFLVAYVRRGSFGYRYRGHTHELIAGSVLLGRPGDEYLCTHDHTCGDECLVFSFAPYVAETIGGAAFWQTGCVPPAAAAMVFGELAQAAATGVEIGLDEAGLLFAASCAGVATAQPPRRIGISTRDRHRMVETALWMESLAHEQICLEAAAGTAGLSPFHFLRLFSAVLGVTPHQYLLRARLRRAARSLAGSNSSITDIAFDSGFADLSNFIRTFHRAAGMSPRRFRQTAGGARNIFQEHHCARLLR